MFDLSGKTAVVTGAASGYARLGGSARRVPHVCIARLFLALCPRVTHSPFGRIGYAVALALSEAGAAVQVLDLSYDAAASAVRQLNARKPQKGVCTAHACDVANEAAVEATLSNICTNGARLDILVCNAGISAVGTVAATTESDMDRVYSVNVKGVFYCLKHGVKRMLADGKGGAIVNLASIASLIGLADRFAYSMTKGAVLAMTRSVACDYVKKGIRCNCVCPGRVHTPFVDGYLAKNYPGREKEMYDTLAKWQPVGRMGRPEEVAALILYLCSDEAAFVTGAAYPIDGGRSAL
jgi:2-keto-3-deoxy-L-fuconate dehydrogenase